MINIDDRILSEVDENQLFLLCAIAKHMGNNAKAWPSNKTLCETTRWSANKLQRVKKSAIEAGVLGAESRFQKNAQTSNLYQIKTRRIGVMVNLADIQPHPQNGVSPHPQNGVSPHPQNGVSEVLTNEVLTIEREGNTPQKNLSNLKEEKKETTPPVAPPPPAETDRPKMTWQEEQANVDSFYALNPPSKKVALKGSTHVGNYEPSEFDMYGIQPLEIYEGDGIAEIEAAARKENNEVWAKITDPKLPGVILVEAITFPAATPAQWREDSKEIQPIARASTILEAEEKILNWAKTHGLETLKFRHITAKRKFVEDDLPALVAHYVSVFASTNDGSRANLMRDPVANFEAGMFKYLTMQNTIDRNNNTTKPSTQAQQTGQTLTSNMRIL